MEIPNELRYSKEHEWIALEGDVATVGITAFAAESLGDVVFVQLPSAGDKVGKDDAIGEVESTKSVSDVYSPLSGEITEVNGATETNPESVNESPYESGWLFKLRLSDTGELETLLDAAAYAELIKEA